LKRGFVVNRTNSNLVCLMFTVLLLGGCSMEASTNPGPFARTMIRNGWTIELDDRIGTASVTDTDLGTRVKAGGHQIDIGDAGVKLDGKVVTTASSGKVDIGDHNGKITLAVNGQNVKVE
jgi:hypothetical protein